MRTEAPIRVCYDDACQLCRRSRRWVEARDRGGVFEFVPLGSGAAGHGSEATDPDLVVLTPDRCRRTGYAGWVTILDALPDWRPVARLLWLPPVRWIGALVYRLVSRHRHRLVRRPGDHTVARPSDEGRDRVP